MWQVIARYRDVDYIIHDDRITDEECKVLSPALTVEDNKSGTLEFTICPSNNGYNKIYPMLTECRVLKNGKIIWFGRVLTADSDFYKRLKIHCEGGLSYLCDFYYPTETLPDPNYKYAFPQAVDGIMYWHNETLTDSKFISYGLFRSFTGKTVAFDGKEVVGRYDDDFIKKAGSDNYRAWPYPERSSMTILDWLLASTAYYNGHLFVTRETASDGTWVQYLNFKSGYNTWTGQTIRFGENLLDYTKSIDGSNFHTAVRPYGNIEVTNGDQSETIDIDVRYILKKYFNDAEKQDFVVTNSATDPSQNYVMTLDKSRNIAYCHSFETNMPDVDGSMQTWADIYGIICKPFEANFVGSEFIGRLISHFRETKPESMVIEIRAVDMDLLGATSSDIEILDMIHVVSKPHNVDGYFPVTKIEYHLDDPSQTTYTIDTGAVESQSSVTGSSSVSVDTKITSSGYKHPTYKENSLGFYKFANDAIGSVTDAQPVTKKDITDLGIPDKDTNTTYRVTSDLFPSVHGVTLRGNDGSSSNAPLDTYRRSLNLTDATAHDMNRVTERGYLFSTHGYAFKLIMSRYDSSHNFEMDGTYVKDDVEYDFIVRGDISVKQDVTTISNLSIECNDPDNQLSVYAYNIFEPATETTDYVYYCAWIALYSSKNLSDWTCSVLVSIHYTDGEYIEPSTPPDSEHAIDYSKLVKQTENVSNENTTYELSKTGSTITLTGSDGSSSSVTDSDTTYSLEQYYDTGDGLNRPSAPVCVLKNSYGSLSIQNIPRTFTTLPWDPIFQTNKGSKMTTEYGEFNAIVDMDYWAPNNYVETTHNTKLNVCINTIITAYVSGVLRQFNFAIYISAFAGYFGNEHAIIEPSGDIQSYDDIRWTVGHGMLGTNSPEGMASVVRIGVDSKTYSKMSNISAEATLTYITGENGVELNWARTICDCEEMAEHTVPISSTFLLSSKAVSDVAFTGDYNDLSNKPTIPDISGKQDKSTAVTHTANTAVGSATKPVYVAENGRATPITHSINADVPANAKFTDTTYSDATQSAHGLMTAADKKKLDSMDLWIAGANNAAKWYRLGTLVSSGNFSNAVIRIWSGDGANGRANQNASFEIQIKDGWQSTESATKACGVTVYRINCRSVKVKVIPTAHNTYTVWVYLPWLYWNGNYAVYGKYKSWTSQQLIQSNEPEGTGSDTAYYDQAFLTSTVAKANEATTLTETAWTDVPETNISPRYGKNIKYLKTGNTVYVRGSISFSASLNNPCCGTMPSDLLPDDYQDHVFTAWHLSSGVPTAYPVVLAKDGKITLMNPTSTSNWFVAGKAYNFNFNYHIN